MLSNSHPVPSTYTFIPPQAGRPVHPDPSLPPNFPPPPADPDPTQICVQAAHEGALIPSGAAEAPFGSIASLFESITPCLTFPLPLLTPADFHPTQHVCNVRTRVCLSRQLLMLPPLAPSQHCLTASPLVWIFLLPCLTPADLHYITLTHKLAARANAHQVCLHAPAGFD